MGRKYLKLINGDIEAAAYYIGLWRWPWELKIETVKRLPWNIATGVEMENVCSILSSVLFELFPYDVLLV